MNGLSPHSSFASRTLIRQSTWLGYIRLNWGITWDRNSFVEHLWWWGGIGIQRTREGSIKRKLLLYRTARRTQGTSRETQTSGLVVNNTATPILQRVQEKKEKGKESKREKARVGGKREEKRQGEGGQTIGLHRVMGRKEMGRFS